MTKKGKDAPRMSFAFVLFMQYDILVFWVFFLNFFVKEVIRMNHLQNALNHFARLVRPLK